MSKSERIEAIVDKYYCNRMLEKANSLAGHVLLYLENKEGLDSFSASLNFVAIEKLCDAYFIDVIRYKEYHIGPSLGNHLTPFSKEWTEALHGEEVGKRIKYSKIAALTVKWLLKCSPISLVLNDGIRPDQISPQEKRISSFINEDFALNHSMTLIKTPISKLIKKDYEDLIYHFKYRNYDERHFFIVYELLREKYSK